MNLAMASLANVETVLCCAWDCFTAWMTVFAFFYKHNRRWPRRAVVRKHLMMTNKYRFNLPTRGRSCRIGVNLAIHTIAPQADPCLLPFNRIRRHAGECILTIDTIAPQADHYLPPFNRIRRNAKECRGSLLLLDVVWCQC